MLTLTQILPYINNCQTITYKLNRMENLNQKADLPKPKSEFITKNHAYSCKRFNAYQTAVTWDGCYEQMMFHVKPIGENGFEKDIAFYFRSIAQMLNFMMQYQTHHKLEFWQSKSTLLNQKSTILLLLYKSRMKVN